MNLWILFLSVLPYVCISILVMSCIWRYDHHFEEKEEKQPLKKVTLISFPLFILFIFIAPLIFLFLFETGNVNQLIQWVKNIITLDGTYQVIITSSFTAKLYIIFLCTIIIGISFPASLRLWDILTHFLTQKLIGYFKFYRLFVRTGVIFLISFFNITK